MPLNTDWRVYLLGYDFTTKAGWNVDIEETLGQPATASFTLQDRVMGDFDFQDLDPGGVGFYLGEIDTRIEIDGAAMPLFRGKILSDDIPMPVGHPWRFHQVQATDYQREVFDRRIVGAPSGSIWAGPDSDGNYVAVDPGSLFGQGESDKAAVQAVFDNFAAVPAFIGTIDAATFVNEYVPSLNGAPYQADKARVRQVLEWLAGQVSANLQYWMDPLFQIHWQAIPRWFEQEGPAFFGPLMLPVTPNPMEVAPFEANNDNPDGVTSVGFRNLGWRFNYSSELHQHFVSGGTGYKYNGGAIDLGGTGWVVFGSESPPIKQLAQDILDVPSSVDPAGKVAASQRARNSTERGILQGRLTIGGERDGHHPDGFHVGQALKITDARMGSMSGRYYCIQRVHTRLVPFTNWRIYDIEWGDAPIARSSTRRPLALKENEVRDPGRLWGISGNVQNPYPSSTTTVVGQLLDDKKQPRRAYGIAVELELHVWDDTGAPQTGVGSISPTTATTDTMGRWQTDMTVGPLGGWSYCVCPVGSNSCSIGS